MIRSLRIRHRSLAWLLLAGVVAIATAVLVRPKSAPAIAVESRPDGSR